MKKSLLVLSSLVTALAADCAPGAATITIDANRPAHAVSPMLWGIFFEDINLSADGGIYAEQVRNRSFEDSDKPEHWKLVNEDPSKAVLKINLEQPVGDLLRTRNRRSLELRVTEASAEKPAGVANDGYWGMALKKGGVYRLSFHARAWDGMSDSLTVSLEGQNGRVYASETVKGLAMDWKPFQVEFKAGETDAKARLVFRVTSPGALGLDMVSLFPAETWKGHGLRSDLMEMLAGLKPAFVRFPGGCWVEGDTMREAYRWKETMGDIWERRTQWNIWGYWATHGLGFHEYLVMCEDLGAEPLFVINCGMSHRENVPMDQMGPLVQDALDAIEYCNGPVTSRWGALRAKNGHPSPFNLKYLQIGNENGGPAYHERWALFHKAIKTRHPEIRLVADVWNGYPTNPMPDIIDEHYYNNPEFFIAQAGKYDQADRRGPKIYVGEYAVTQGCGKGNLRGAIGEAAFMIGMERNSDIVVMASYAPLFVHLNHRRWNPDLINYDSSGAYGIPSYYVQQLFARHRGDVVLPTAVETPLAEAGNTGGKIGVGTWATQAEFKDIKVTKDGQTLFASDFTSGVKGWKMAGKGDWKVQDGALRQSGAEENVRALAGDRQWKDYTLSLKARKLGGAEGFLIIFRLQNDNAKSWWNLGGWGNRQHGLEVAGATHDQKPGRIETGRWYDIRVELKGANVKCYLDGQLIHDVNCQTTLKAIHASATRDRATGEMILKVVNASPDSQTARIQLTGKQIAGPIEALVLTGQPEDENSLEQPAKVSPRPATIQAQGSTVEHSFPGNSFSVWRLKDR